MMEKELICASSERDSAQKKMLKMMIEVDEANQLTTEAVSFFLCFILLIFNKFITS